MRHWVQWFVAIAFTVSAVACEVDSVTWVSFGGQRYGGAIIPLDVELDDLTIAGDVEDSNDPIFANGQVLALRGVDPRRVLMMPGRSSEEPDYFVFFSEALGPGNVFNQVPELCAYASTQQPECED